MHARTFVSAALLLALVNLCGRARAAADYSFAQVTAFANGNSNNGIWSDSDDAEITTPTAGESATATVIPSFVGAFTSGQGTTTSFLSLNADGFSGELTQSSEVVPAQGGGLNTAAATNSGGDFVDFSLSVPHYYTITASGQMQGPAAPDDDHFGVQIQLSEGSDFPFDYVQQTQGPISFSQSGVLDAGDYSFYAVMINQFEYDATVAGFYTSSGNYEYSLTLTPVPEPSALVIAIMAVAGALVASRRR